MSITVAALGQSLGIEVTGLSGAAVANREGAGRCLRTLEEHGVMVYRHAHLNDDQLAAFSRMLGDVAMVPRGAVRGYREVEPVTWGSPAGVSDHDPLTWAWRIDGAADMVPGRATLLSAQRISEETETEFASTYAAFEALPDTERAELTELRVEHSFAASQRLLHPDAEAEELAAWAKVPVRVQPLTWTRKNGRTSLLIGATATGVVGRSPEAGRDLLDRLLDWSTQPQFTLRHRWRAGDLVVWDNSGILHRARSTPDTPPSVLHRTTIAGEEAIA